MKRMIIRPQRTIEKPVEVRGIGFITGANITLRFLPAEASTGVVFRRVDLQPKCDIPADFKEITGTSRRTTLGYMPRCVTLVEHVLAALNGLRVDNCIVELNGMEPPGMDGSASPFVKAIQEAGVVKQSQSKKVWAPKQPIHLKEAKASLSIHPCDSDELRISYILDYGINSPIVPQMHTCTIRPETFLNELGHCRTYLLENEAEELRKQGIGSRTRVTDLVVFGDNGPISNTLRHANEPARHKILDIVGDIALSGLDVRGHIVAYRSGHSLNARLVQAIHEQLGQPQQKRRRLAA